MKEGMYSVRYTGPAGEGWGIIVFDTGVVWGVDVAGGLWDGTYEFNQQTQRIDAKLRMKIPPGAQLVVEAIPHGVERSFELSISLPRELDEPTSGSVNFLGHKVTSSFRKRETHPTATSCVGKKSPALRWAKEQTISPWSDRQIES